MTGNAGALWVGVTLFLTATVFAAGQPAPPPDKGEEILNGSCTAACHDIRPIQVQALDKAGWSNLVDRMIQRGAIIENDKDVETLVDYLVRHHGPLPEGAGKNILLNTCTVCHDLQRVKTEAANREQWEEILGTMLNEGAMLSEQDFPVLLDYLARNFRPQ